MQEARIHLQALRVDIICYMKNVRFLLQALKWIYFIYFQNLWDVCVCVCMCRGKMWEEAIKISQNKQMHERIFK